MKTLSFMLCVLWSVILCAQDKQDQSGSSNGKAPDNKQGTDNSPLVVKVVPTPKTAKETADEAEEHKQHTSNERETLLTNHRLFTVTWVLAGRNQAT